MLYFRPFITRFWTFHQWNRIFSSNQPRFRDHTSRLTTPHILKFFHITTILLIRNKYESHKCVFLLSMPLSRLQVKNWTYRMYGIQDRRPHSVLLAVLLEKICTAPAALRAPMLCFSFQHIFAFKGNIKRFKLHLWTSSNWSEFTGRAPTSCLLMIPDWQHSKNTFSYNATNVGLRMIDSIPYLQNTVGQLYPQLQIPMNSPMSPAFITSTFLHFHDSLDQSFHALDILGQYKVQSQSFARSIAVHQKALATITPWMKQKFLALQPQRLWLISSATPREIVINSLLLFPLSIHTEFLEWTEFIELTSAAYDLPLGQNFHAHLGSTTFPTVSHVLVEK